MIHNAGHQPIMSKVEIRPDAAQTVEHPSHNKENNLQITGT